MLTTTAVWSLKSQNKIWSVNPKIRRCRIVTINWLNLLFTAFLVAMDSHVKKVTAASSVVNGTSAVVVAAAVDHYWAA